MANADEQIIAWRRERLYRAGMPEELCDKLAKQDGWRLALTLMGDGCDPRLAYRIARER